MRFSDKAIVLQAIRHGDRRQILKLYTRGHGLVTAITSVGKSPSSKVRAAAALPLSLIHAELIVKQNREIQQLTEAGSSVILSQIGTSIAKLSIAQFINEILIKSLKEQQPNPALFDFIEHSLIYLDEAERDYANLHLWFLLELSRHLGFEPHNNYSREDCYFDCREGAFGPASLAFPLGLNQEDSRLFSEFMKVNSLTAPISREQRSVLLGIMIAYYQLHVPGFREVNSLEVLREVLNG